MIVVRYKIKFRIWDEGFEFLDVWWLDLGFNFENKKKYDCYYWCNFENKKNMIVIIDVLKWEYFEIDIEIFRVIYK